MADDLTQYALEGYEGKENKHLYSSNCFYAHELGRYFQGSGRTKPSDVRMSRGHSIRAGDMLFKITESISAKDGSLAQKFTRIN